MNDLRTQTTELPASSRTRTARELALPLLYLVLPLYVLDQITKWWVVKNIELNFEAITVIPNFFELVHVTNTGAAFGSFKNNNLFFIVLSLAALAVVLALLFRDRFVQSWTRAGAYLLLTGVLGNLTDRLIHGHVIDFVDLQIAGYHWPAFNVADSCISIAAGLFIISAFRDVKNG